MLKLVYTNRFLKSAKKLPSHIQNKLADKMGILQENPFHRSLRTKSLTGALSGFYSYSARAWIKLLTSI